MARRPRIMITVDGKETSLRYWVESQGESYEKALRRWAMGERDPNKLIDGIAKKKITEEGIKWLRATRWCRRGQPNEWEIACDLIGVPHSMAEIIQRMVTEEEP